MGIRSYRYGTRSNNYLTTLMNIVGFLSWILSGAMTNGQNVKCDSRVYVQPDTQHSFSYNYRGLWTYTWCFSTAQGYEVTLNCPEVTMTKFTGWCRDTLNITTTGIVRDGQVFCDPFEVTGRTIIMKLFSIDGKGNFNCKYKSERADVCYCGYAGDSRLKITRGTPTDPHEFTSMAGIIDAEGQFLQCGATLIHKRLALTAAHCVVDAKFKPLDSRKYGLLVGAYRLSQAGNTSSSYLYRIQRFLPNAGYNNNIQADIALVETVITMWFDRNVGPACLPYKFSGYLFQEHATVVGWGHTEYGGSSSDVLLKGAVTIQYPSRCSGVSAYRGKYSSETMICLSGDGVDACQHDSGGPVYYTDPTNGLLFSLGVTNVGVGCGGPTPSISARVFSYLEWIHAVYPGASYCVIP